PVIAARWRQDGRRSGRRSRRHRDVADVRPRADRCRQRSHLGLRVEVGFQLEAQLGIAAQERIPVGGPAGIDGFQVGGQDLADALVVFQRQFHGFTPVRAVDVAARPCRGATGCPRRKGCVRRAGRSRSATSHAGVAVPPPREAAPAILPGRSPAGPRPPHARPAGWATIARPPATPRPVPTTWPPVRPAPVPGPRHACPAGSRAGRWPGCGPGSAAASTPSPHATAAGSPSAPAAPPAASAARYRTGRAWPASADRAAPAPAGADRRGTSPALPPPARDRRTSLTYLEEHRCRGAFARDVENCIAASSRDRACCRPRPRPPVAAQNLRLRPPEDSPRAPSTPTPLGWGAAGVGASAEIAVCWEGIADFASISGSHWSAVLVLRLHEPSNLTLGRTILLACRGGSGVRLGNSLGLQPQRFTGEHKGKEHRPQYKAAPTHVATRRSSSHRPPSN